MNDAIEKAMKDDWTIHQPVEDVVLPYPPDKNCKDCLGRGYQLFVKPKKEKRICRCVLKKVKFGKKA